MKNKVIITGHTKGIGLALFNKFNNCGNDVVGFSRSTGHDISLPESIDKIIQQSTDADIFINNAYHETGQTEILKKMIDIWQGTDKLIINISSKLVFIPQLNIHTEYLNAKLEQNKIVEKTFYSTHPNVLNILLGCVDTDMAVPFKCIKISPTDLADFIYDVIKWGDKLAIQQLILDVPTLDWKDIKY